MIGRCTNGPSRREWLRTLGWQFRPTLRRIGRRFVRRAWLVVVHLLAGFGVLCLLSLFLKSCGVA